MKITTDYPHKDLMPNRKNGKHWTATKTLKDAQFASGFYSAKEALKGNQLNQLGNYSISITYCQSDKRHRDLDNLLAASKALLDGVAKALGIDDKQFQPILIDRFYGDKFEAIIEIEA